MKSRVTVCLLMAVLILGSAMAASAQAAEEEQPTQPRFKIGFYWEGFQINDKNLTKFYGQFQKNPLGFEASAHTLYNIDVWASYRTFGLETKTTFDGHDVKFRLKAASLGVIYRPTTFGLFEPFIGAGLEFYSYSETIGAESDIPGTSGNVVGFHIQIGTYVDITDFLAGKVFVRLNGAKKTLADPLPDDGTKLDLGGKEFGLGLLFRF